MPFRRNKRGGLVATATDEVGGYYVGEGHTPKGSGKLEIGKIQARSDAEMAELPITDLASMEVACDGLPTSSKIMIVYIRIEPKMWTF